MLTHFIPLTIKKHHIIRDAKAGKGKSVRQEDRTPSAHILGPSNKTGSGGITPENFLKIYIHFGAFWSILVLLFHAKKFENRH